MNDIYTPAINTFIEQIKGDKSIVQPWRNYALKHLGEALADIHEGQRVTNLTPPEGTPGMVDTAAAVKTGMCICDPDMPPRKNCVVHGVACVCPQGGKKRECPIHGWQVKA